MDFEEWFKSHRYSDVPLCYGAAKDAFKAGQQSKQAEIDAIKAKIEDITKWAEFHIEDYNLSESDSEHDRGWFNAACQVFKSLKGEQQ